jgi:hypothetical protein
MTYLRAQFHTPNSSVSLVIAITAKAKETLRVAAMLLFYLDKSGNTFSRSINNRLFQGFKVSTARAIPSLKFACPP